MKRPSRLTEVFVEAINRKGIFTDGLGGYGLRLSVMPRARGGVRKAWRQRLTIDGKQKELGLGSYPVVRLVDARAIALENARMVQATKTNPIHRFLAAPEAPAPAPAAAPAPAMVTPTFAELANDWIDFQAQRLASSSITNYKSVLRNWQLPSIGDIPVGEIQSAHIVDMLKPKWISNYPTASNALIITKRIFDYAISQDMIAVNPVFKAELGLPKINHKPKHADYIEWRDMPDALDKIAKSKSGTNSKLAFAFMALTGCRDGALTAFEWEDIQETDNGLYHLHIPEDREGQKTANGFNIPLSTQAVRILDMARVGSPEIGNIFNIKKRTIGMMLKRQGLVSGTNSHGTRSTITTWAQECTDYPKDLIDECLAHTVNNRVQAAYFQSDRLEKRRAVLQDYSDTILPMDSIIEWITNVIVQ